MYIGDRVFDVDGGGLLQVGYLGCRARAVEPDSEAVP
jgi:hypothetical protein